MLSLVHKTQVARLHRPAILKVVDAEEFAKHGWPMERSALLLSSVAESHQVKFLALPWGAVVADDLDVDGFSGPVIRYPQPKEVLSPGDIVEVAPNRTTLRVLYRRGDLGNVIFATERCNSYCLMCSQPPRDVDDRWRVQQNLELIPLIDRDEPSLAITGGEPTLLGEGLTQIINACASQLPETDLQVLTNGRAFCRPEASEALQRIAHPKLQWNVPLYADVAPIHDFVVQAQGAFQETVSGLYALGRADMNIEVRVVLHRPTITRLRALTHYIYRNLTFVRHVALMGIESIGFALANRDQLWIDPVEYQSELQDAVAFLNERGIRVSIYNLPLCVLAPAVRPFAAKSISTWKNVYLPECASCEAKSQCGGFFASINKQWTSRGIGPIKTGGPFNGVTT